MKQVLVWDTPTRLFHWLLVICFAGAWVSSSSDRWLSIHIFLGYLMLGLIAFRLVWGLVGGRYARFTSFVASPRAAWHYLHDLLAGRDRQHLGHNPAASLAIIAMLVLGVAVALTGMFTQGGEERQGAVPGLLSIGAGGWMDDGESGRTFRHGPRARCAACHLDALAGTFEDAAMRIPRESPVQGANPTTSPAR